MSANVSNDEAIMATNDDATSCKAFAIQKDYWKDPFVAHFVKSTVDRRAPEINRGYFARVSGIVTLLNEFIERVESNYQIVNFGAGYDTLYWRLKDQGVKVSSFVEVDFPGVTAHKIQTIKSKRVLLETLVKDDDEVQFSSCDMHCGSYHLLGLDLRTIADLNNKLLPHLDVSLPTIFIAECVLVYLEAEKSANILRWITSHFTTASFINYEQVNIDDKFGHVMVENLKKRDCSLFGISSCRSLETQKNRFLAEGWDTASVWDMNQVYELLPRIEVERIEKLEFLDEHELLQQLLQHYCIALAVKGDRPELLLSDIGFT